MIAFLKNYAFHNLGLKLLSLLLATGLWFLISRDEQLSEVAVRAPIVFQNMPADLMISSESIPETQIRVRGPERVISQLTGNDVQAELDLVGTKPQERTFDVTPRQVRHPREVQVIQIVPSQLRLAFDMRATRDVEIRPRFAGTLPEGARIDCDPPRITITGPRAHIDRIDVATTDPIDALGAHGTSVFTSSVYVPDPLVQVEQTTSVRVTVVVPNAGGPDSH